MGERKLTKWDQAALSTIDHFHDARDHSAYVVQRLLKAGVIRPTHLPCGCVGGYRLTTRGRTALEANHG